MSVHSKTLLALGLGAACLLAAVPVSGQIVYGMKPAGGVDFVATHWKLSLADEEVTVDQIAVPVSAYVPLGEDFEGRVYAAQTFNSVSEGGQDYNLDGLTDLRLQLNHAFSRDRLLLGAGVNLPTGKKSLSLDEEWAVMNFLSQSFLNFPVRRLGEGFGLNLMAGGATEWNEYKLGATATFDLTNSYEAYTGEDDYEPGNTFALTVGLQRDFDGTLFNGDVSFTTSAEDQQGGQPIFARGDQLSLHTSLGQNGDSRRWSADAIYHVRGRNTIYDPDGILLQQLKIYGNEFVAAGTYQLGAEDGWQYGPAADIRFIAGNEYGLGSSKVLGLAGNLARRLSPTIDLTLSLKYYTGSTHDGAIDLSGYQAWLAAQATF